MAWVLGYRPEFFRAYFLVLCFSLCGLLAHCGGGVSRDPKFVLRNIWTAPYGSAPENSRSLMSHWCGQCWNLSWWKCRQSVSLSICGSFRHIFHLVISIQGLVKMLFRVDIQVDQGVNTLILQGVDTYQSDTFFGRCQHLPKHYLLW